MPASGVGGSEAACSARRAAAHKRPHVSTRLKTAAPPHLFARCLQSHDHIGRLRHRDALGPRAHLQGAALTTAMLQSTKIRLMISGHALYAQPGACDRLYGPHVRKVIFAISGRSRRLEGACADSYKCKIADTTTVQQYTRGHAPVEGACVPHPLMTENCTAREASASACRTHCVGRGRRGSLEGS